MNALKNFRRLEKRQRAAAVQDAGAPFRAFCFRKRSTAGFTLLEVMIAVGVLFMCLFAVLALTSNSLASARKIQGHRDLDAGTFVGFFYVQLANTNRIDEGPADFDMKDTFPGYKMVVDCALAGTNGLWDVEYDVAEPTRRAEVHGHFLIFNPNSKQPGISKSLPRH